MYSAVGQMSSVVPESAQDQRGNYARYNSGCAGHSEYHRKVSAAPGHHSETGKVDVAQSPRHHWHGHTRTVFPYPAQRSAHHNYMGDDAAMPTAPTGACYPT